MRLFFKLIEIVIKKYQEASYNLYRRKYNIDDTFRFNGKDILLYGDGEIELGRNSYIGDFSTIQATKGTIVIIGENCSISHNVRIYTSNRNPDDIISERPEISIKKGNVLIGDNSWIGANVFIKEGVEIGSNCVIGANSMVTKNIPSNSLAVGNPARVIKHFNKSLGKIEKF